MATTTPSSTWPSELCGNLYRMRCDMALCDTTVIGSDGETLCAHSAVLAASCELLKAKLIACLKNDAPFTVHVDGISGYLWDLVLRFIYSGKTEPKNTLQAQGLLHAGEALAIEPLANIGGQFLAAGNGDSEVGNCESDTNEVRQLVQRLRTPSRSSRCGPAMPSYAPSTIPSTARGTRSPSPYLRSPSTSRRHMRSISPRHTRSPSPTLLSRRPVQLFSLSYQSNPSNVAERGEDSPCSWQLLTTETDKREYVTYATSPEANIQNATPNAGRPITGNASAATQTIPTGCRSVNESGKGSKTKSKVKKSGKRGKSCVKPPPKRCNNDSVVNRRHGNRVDSTKQNVDPTLLRKALDILKKLNMESCASEQTPARVDEQDGQVHAKLSRNVRYKPTYSGGMTRDTGATVADWSAYDQNLNKHTSEAPWHYCACIPGIPVVSDEQVFSGPGPLSAKRHHEQDTERDCMPEAYDYYDDPYTSDASNNASDGAVTERISSDLCPKCLRRDRSPPPKRLYACPSCGNAYSHLSQLQRHRMCRHSNT